jgi:hypothetical protein
VPGRLCTSGVVRPSSTRNDTNQCLPSRVNVAERMVSPSRQRDARNVTHPSLGSLTRDLRRFSFSTFILEPSGNRNDGAHRRFERHRTLSVPCLRHAVSRSRSACCKQCDGTSPSQACSYLASTNSWACCS